MNRHNNQYLGAIIGYAVGEAMKNIGEVKQCDLKVIHR